MKWANTVRIRPTAPRKNSLSIIIPHY